MKNHNTFHDASINLGWRERTYCSALEDIRTQLKCLEKHSELTSFEKELKGIACTILTLVEEIQVYGNRMEAKLSDSKAFDKKFDTVQKLKEEYKKLVKEEVELENESSTSTP